MKSLGLRGYALAMGAASALLVGCGGSRPLIGAPEAMKQSRVVAEQAAHGKSRMRPSTSSETLIYAVGGCNGTCVLSYPSGAFVSAIPAGGVGICSDSSGNVFIAQDSTIAEYAHGASSPTATLTLPGYAGAGCSVDPATNDLAVVFSGSETNLAIFQNEQGTPTLYQTGIGTYYCGYDNNSNLFVNGVYQTQYALSELPKNGATFHILTAPTAIGTPGQLQWDGTYLTYESRSRGNAKLSRLSVGPSSVSIVSSAPLRNATRQLSASWIYDGTVLVPFNNRGTRMNVIGKWKYPKGGKAQKLIRKFDDFKKKNISFQGVTVSIARSH